MHGQPTSTFIYSKQNNAPINRIRKSIVWAAGNCHITRSWSCLLLNVRSHRQDGLHNLETPDHHHLLKDPDNHLHENSKPARGMHTYQIHEYRSMLEY
jgi:hypothetical protein